MVSSKLIHFMDIRDISAGQQVKLTEPLNILVEIEGAREIISVEPETLARVISVTHRANADPVLKLEFLVCVERNGLKIHKPHQIDVPHPRGLVRPAPENSSPSF